MDKLSIKKFAIYARNELIERVTQRAYVYGVVDDAPDAAEKRAADGRPFTEVEQRQRARLVAEVRAHGYQAVMEAAAYTWFNRFAALRFLEVNDYLPSGVRVFSDEGGAFRPAILDECIHMDEPWLDKVYVFACKEANETAALYRYLLIAQCNDLGTVLPALFEPIADWTELLFPDHILREGSVIDHLVADIPEEDWRDAVQIIGWLYQYYNTEPKDAVFAALKKNQKITKATIPAATQLFTPDWIVRYMVENSLGRLWLERHPECTAEEFHWRYYLPEAKQTPDVAAALAKLRAEAQGTRPEDLRVIDPCMGSGHILVYAFDVLYQIYEAAGYPRRKIASLILENNLYGLDIDERAYQLATFAVMMKARQYDSRILTRGLTPHLAAIEETNGLAKWDGPITEETAVLAEVNDLIDTFHDAKEYGSLLTVAAPKEGLLERWEALKQAAAGDLVLGAWVAEVGEMVTKLVEQAELLAGRYDIVVTNPPYMGRGMNGKLVSFIQKHYADYKSDLFSACIVKFTQMAKSEGYLGFLSPYVWMFIASYEKLRKFFTEQKTIETLIQFEYSAFEEATVPICSFVIRNSYVDKRGVYLRLTAYRGGMEVQRTKALEAIKTHAKEMYFVQNASVFRSIPGQPIAYWISAHMLENFSSPKLYDVARPRQGLATTNNDLFLRLWFEPSFKKIGFGMKDSQEALESKRKWFPCNKGGAFRRWYGNNFYIVNYEHNGKTICDYIDNTPGVRVKSNGRVINRDLYFHHGMTWSSISSSLFSMRFVPDGYIFETKGSMCFSDDEKLPYLLGLYNTKVMQEYLKIVSPTLDYHEGPLGRTPVIIENDAKIHQLVRENIALSKSDWDSFETSWDFARHPLLTYGASLLSDAFAQWQATCEEWFLRLKSNEEELNRIFIDIYGLGAELSPEVAEKDVTVARIFDTAEDIPAAMKGNAYVLTRADVARSLVSYAVGCMFGRYSLDEDGLVFAGGTWDAGRYQTFVPDRDAILPVCDDDYFEDDLVNCYERWLAAAFGKETVDANLRWTAEALGLKGTPRETLRDYFLHGFYADHLRRYQSRPIYWLCDAGRRDSFKALMYLHRYDRDTMARLRMGYVYKQQKLYEAKIELFTQRVATAASTAEKNRTKKTLKKLQDQFTEIKAYEEKVHHFADSRIVIDLDDGVKRNYEIFKDVLGKMKR